MALWPRAVIAIAASRVAMGLALYLSGQVSRTSPPPLPLAIYAALAATFAALGVTLAAANRRDVRALWLGGVFVLVAAPLSSPFFSDRSLNDFGWLTSVRVDAFLPAFLWRFVTEFPSPLTGRRGRAALGAGRAAALLGLLLFLVNLSFLSWAPFDGAHDWRLKLRPFAGSGSFYYPLVLGVSAAAFPALVWRAWSARREERRQVLLFTAGLVGGSAPLAVQAMLEAIPAYYAFVHQPGVELVVGVLMFGALASVPFVTAYSVLFDRVVELRVVLRAALQYGLARYTILAAAAVPFAALVLVALSHREEPLAAILAGPRPMVLGVMAGGGLLTLRLRQSLLNRLDRRFFREPYDARQVFDRLVTDALRVTDAVDLARHLREAIDRALHADASLFVADEALGVVQRPLGPRDPLSLTGILMTLAVADSAPMDVDPSDDRSPFRRLPPDEQHWLVAGRFRLLLALRNAAGQPLGLVALTSKRSGLAYADEDHRLLSAIRGSVSLALDNLRLRATPTPSPEPPARECRACMQISPSGTETCTCGGLLVAAPAPYLLRGVFQLDRRVGAGGMGVVYHARDLNLDRSVAIKTLPRVTPESVERLRREARAMATVMHPNLAVIHGLETWQGIPFLIEEYVAGGTLAGRLRRERLTLPDAFDLGLTLAGVLGHLHGARLIHRDIKPSNIGFTGAGVVKLLDFGLARLLAGGIAAPDDATLTFPAPVDGSSRSDLAFVGTPPYMSPDALAGRPAQPSFDLWSLSVVLYESMTGRRPFPGRDATEMVELMAAGHPPAPSGLIEGCPAGVDAYFERAFSREPSRRPASAEAIAVDLLKLRQTRHLT